MQQSSHRGLSGIRMTNAQIYADNAVKEKLQKVAAPTEQKKEFKLKRFQDVNPRTSTKRTGGGYASMNNVLQKEEPKQAPAQE